MLDTSIFHSRILVVEPQRLQGLLLEKILKTAGFRSIECLSDPHQVIISYAESAPDLILLEMEMDGMDGFRILELLKKAKETEDYLPVIVLSSDKSQDMKLRALEAGATDLLNKPYEEIEVVVRVKNLLETRMLHKQVRDQNRILEERVRERTKELRDTRLDIIHRLAQAAEYRDNDTGMHIIRMSQYCAKLAEEVGMNNSQCELILHASPLHDIGKIGIPDSVLLKPGKLTPEEWEIMKTHTTIGGELLDSSSSPLMKTARIIALTHHERWDGKGYPKGIKGEDIPLVGRICSICDVFDALTSRRPYKKAWPVEDALNEIEKSSGAQFDSQLIRPFRKISGEFEIIHKKYAD